MVESVLRPSRDYRHVFFLCGAPALWVMGLVCGCSSEEARISDTGLATDDGATTQAGSGTTTGTTASSTTSVADTSGGSSAGTFGKLDFPTLDLGEDNCSATDFSHIWIANTSENTVSKIDTRTRVELGRYLTAPGDASPSRTSVNLAGDVAVLNRKGSVTKIAGTMEQCVDRNSSGTIETSMGSANVLPWGTDECVLWHVDFVTATETAGPRVAAWTHGSSSGECPDDQAPLWIGWSHNPTSMVHLRLMDSETGATVNEITTPSWHDPPNSGHPAYGGALDRDGNLWIVGKGSRSLTKVEQGTNEVTTYTNPDVDFQRHYGLAVDAHGTPWIATVLPARLYRFDVTTETFSVKLETSHSRFRGLAIDDEGHVWIAANLPCNLVEYDTNTEQVVDDAIELPGCSSPVGVAVDTDGFVWVVDQLADQAFKVDPSDHSTEVVTGLNNPYTYSDMTGRGLRLVTDPPM